jgi:hypothetical protein
MDMTEYKTKRLRMEDRENIYLDLRPFGEKESDAIDFCIQETLAAVRRSGPSKQKLVLICEPTTRIPSHAEMWLLKLKELGQATEIRPQHRETTE